MKKLLYLLLLTTLPATAEPVTTEEHQCRGMRGESELMLKAQVEEGVGYVLMEGKDWQTVDYGEEGGTRFWIYPNTTRQIQMRPDGTTAYLDAPVGARVQPKALWKCIMTSSSQN